MDIEPKTSHYRELLVFLIAAGLVKDCPSFMATPAAPRRCGG